MASWPWLLTTFEIVARASPEHAMILGDHPRMERSMKPSFAIAAGLVLVIMPALAQSHHKRVRAAPARGSEVAFGLRRSGR